MVSNRLPFVLKRNEDESLVRRSSAGGLVTAVAPVVVQSKGLFVVDDDIDIIFLGVVVL